MSIAKQYEVLEELMNKNKDDEINEVFRKILEDTFKLVNKKIENEKTLDVENLEEAAAIRAMFEYMLELWDEQAIDEAKELELEELLVLTYQENLFKKFKKFTLRYVSPFKTNNFESFFKFKCLIAFLILPPVPIRIFG